MVTKSVPYPIRSLHGLHGACNYLGNLQGVLICDLSHSVNSLICPVAMQAGHKNSYQALIPTHLTFFLLQEVTYLHLLHSPRIFAVVSAPILKSVQRLSQPKPIKYNHACIYVPYSPGQAPMGACSSVANRGVGAYQGTNMR